MLERILNIKTELDLTRKQKSSYEKFLTKPSTVKEFGRDSIVFSPAAIYMARLNWHLLEVSQIKDGCMRFSFVIEGKEFSTELCFKTFYSDIRQSYRVSKDFDDNKKTIIEVSVFKDLVKLEDEGKSFSLKNLNILFGRIVDLELSGSIERPNSCFLEELMDGIEIPVAGEFANIQASLYSFIHKLGKFNFIKNYSFRTDFLDPVIIDKITTIDG